MKTHRTAGAALTRPAITRAAITLAALCAALAVAPPARADGDPTTDQVPRMLPYQGMLELDGRPINATGEDALHLLFSLYDANAPETAVYSQPLVVEVYNGRFTATIGPVGQGPDGAERAIADVIAAADELALGITLLGDPDDPADDIPLNNRQRIHATPYAMWSTTATNLSVAGQAHVGGDLDVRGDARIGGSLRVDGAVTFPANSIDTNEIANSTLRAQDFDPAAIGDGLVKSAADLHVDGDWVDSRIRDWVRAHCQVQLGWRDNCTDCQNAPAKHATVRGDGVCTGAVGADTSCRANNTWGGVNTDGDVDGNDVFYIRLVCN